MLGKVDGLTAYGKSVRFNETAAAAVCPSADFELLANTRRDVGY